jgi:FMN phosphatase YigB (HAD superfamily)
VVSPFQAILDYEKSHNIPVGWVNYSIAHSPKGAWGKVERGQILVDKTFFADFKRDLTDEKLWREYDAKIKARTGKSSETDKAPPIPDINSEELYWEMMRIARKPDPHMFPALRRLRRAADASKGKLILGALSNTSIFPPGHPFNDPSTEDGRFNAELRSMFDIFVSSAHVGMRKPEKGIYEYAVIRLHEFVKLEGYGIGVRPQDITFLDDIGTNLRTAKQLGFNTIKVQLGKADLAVAELEKLTGLTLSGEKAQL